MKEKTQNNVGGVGWGGGSHSIEGFKQLSNSITILYPNVAKILCG